MFGQFLKLSAVILSVLLLLLCVVKVQSRNLRDVEIDHLESKLDKLLNKLYGDLVGDLEVWEPRHSDHLGHDNALKYTNEWLVHVPKNGSNNDEHVRILAQETGYTNMGQVKGFPDVYLFVKPDHPEHQRSARDLTQTLQSDKRVLWCDQQFAKYRHKRSFESVGNFIKNSIYPRPQVQMSLSDARFNDELWDKEWYMQDTRTKSSLPRLDLNVLKVFDMGITGKDVNVLILDDGLEHTHSDLVQNYNAKISGDLNDNDFDPMPHFNAKTPNAHGTRCAGEIAMKANNSKCGVGIAYDANIGGVRMLDGPVSDRIEGEALSYAIELVDIYSASWGPNDDGMTVEGPGRLAQRALLKGITQGRGGKGSIHVWASGNGGAHFDCCSVDGYASSIYTLSIGSASESGKFPWYGERCPSTLAVTYSSGAYTDQKIATTDLNDQCTTGHTGTSASAPLAAGIIALVFEANPNLNWRDVQHLVVWSSQPDPLKDNPGWAVNDAGFHFSPKFGFGLMDAHGIVSLAKNWTNVPEQTVCRAKAMPLMDKIMNGRGSRTIQFFTDGCKNTPNEVNYIEHVEVITTIQYSNRGALEIELLSPRGTRTTLLFPRKLDISSTGFSAWPFMSTHTWGENPSGQWTLNVTDTDTLGIPGENEGFIHDDEMELIIYGTRSMPAIMQGGKRIYPHEYKKKKSIQDSEYPEILHESETKAAESDPEISNSEYENEKSDSEVLRLEKVLRNTEEILVF